MRFLFILTFILFISNNIYAQTSGTGCLVENLVYTEYLGEGDPYGNGQNKKIYRKTGGATAISINYNGYSNTKPNNENYICGVINEYYSPIEKHEIKSISYSSCVTRPSINGNVNGDGALVTYQINNPAYCGSTQVPIDDYIPLFLAIIIAISCPQIKKIGMNTKISYVSVKV